MTLYNSESRHPVKDHRLLVLISFGITACAFVACRYIWNPGFERLQRYAQWVPLRCPLKLVTDLDCPVCGLGRSLLSIASGNWKGAWEYNSLGPILSIALVLGLVFYLLNPKLFWKSCLSMKSLWQLRSERFRKVSLSLFAAMLILKTISLNSNYLSIISP